jgi:hypothetical protein
MANTVLSNTNLTWLHNKWGSTAPLSNAEFDVYRFDHTPMTLSRELHADDFTNNIAVETFMRSNGQQIIVVWKEIGANTSYIGSSEHINGGWD